LRGEPAALFGQMGKRERYEKVVQIITAPGEEKKKQRGDRREKKGRLRKEHVLRCLNQREKDRRNQDLGVRAAPSRKKRSQAGMVLVFNRGKEKRKGGPTVVKKKKGKKNKRPRVKRGDEPKKGEL